MSESKGKILFVILAILLLLFGGGTILYPSLNGLWVERTMHRDSEDFLLLLEEDAERTAEENSHVIPEEPESEKSNVPEQYSQLWLDIYFGASMDGDRMPDVDGAQYVRGGKKA